MPSVSDAIKSAQQFKDQTPVAPMIPVGPPVVNPSLEPIRSSYMRSPAPVLWKDSADANRQLYVGSMVPQQRVMIPNQVVANGALSESTTVSSGSSSGGGSGGNTTPPTAQQVSITSGPLNPGQTFVSSVQIAKSFALLRISVSGPSRVQLYGTSLAQSSDAYRGLDVPLPAGTVQNLICDVALDTSPFVWSFQDRVGANADSPQTSATYVTLTNIGSASETVTLTLSFVPLES